MSRHYALSDLRRELSIELRNHPGSKARYSDDELDVAIRRATNLLAEYFWMPETDESKSVEHNVYEYIYDYPIRGIYRIAFIPGDPRPHRYGETFYEDEDGVLILNSNHPTCDKIKVWYERHPVPYPSDLVLAANVNSSAETLSISAGTNVLDWPDTGWFKINNEVMKYTSIDRGANTLTVVRAQLSSAAASHAKDSKLSFVNRVAKPVFFEGVKDLAFAYLNRTRIIDAPVSEVQGNVTVMNDILESQRGWIRQHRMRSMRQSTSNISAARPMKGRRRGT